MRSAPTRAAQACTLLLLLALGTANTAAQARGRPRDAEREPGPDAPRVVVRDSIDRPIPFANIQSGGGSIHVASDSGIALLRVPRADSLRLLVRRIGFKPFDGWVRPGADGSYAVLMSPLPQNLNRVTIYERNTPLARTGFYDRMERVRRGAIVGRFITPEEIEQRNATRASRLLEGEMSIRVRSYSVAQKAVISGRGGTCAAGILVDGKRMNGMAEEVLTTEGQDEIMRLARKYPPGPDALEKAEREFLAARTSIDEVVSSLAVTAIEIYPSMAGVPAELQREAPKYACSLVVIWTGRR